MRGLGGGIKEFKDAVKDEPKEPSKDDPKDNKSYEGSASQTLEYKGYGSYRQGLLDGTTSVVQVVEGFFGAHRSAEI